MELNLPTHPIPDRVSITRPLAAGQKLTLAELDGPGCIRHIWLTPTRHEMGNRQTIIRIYFDDDPAPYVEAPVGDFFGIMHGKRFYPLNTRYLSVKAEAGYDCYFEMPFARSARIEFEAGPAGNSLYLMVDWHRYPDQQLAERSRFCARWRRELPATHYGQEYLLLDADGPGRLLGFVYGVRLLDNADRWSHGGGDNLYIDGGTANAAYVRGIGGEDCFGAGYGGALHNPVESNLYQGLPYYVHEDTGEARVAQRLVGYRFFEHDTIPFRSSLQFRFGCMENDICSTVYWYQERPVRPYFRMPSWEHLLALPARIDRLSDKERHTAGTYDLPLPDAGSWWLCGPFGNDGGKAIDTTLPPERELATGAIYDAGHEPVSRYLDPRSQQYGRHEARWVRHDAQHGFIDFNHFFRCCVAGVGVHHPAVAVARATVTAPAAGPAELLLGWDDQLILTINGERRDLGMHRAFRVARVVVALRAGANEIILKLSNTTGSNHGGWAFSFGCTQGNSGALLPRAAVL